MIVFMNLLHLFYEIIFHQLRIENDSIFFQSFNGQYNDNPRAISEELHTLHPEIKQYWYISDRSAFSDVPPYINVIKKKNIKYFYRKNKCRFLVGNGAGFNLRYKKNDFLIKLLKNKKQFEIATWHGYPIKCVGKKIVSCIDDNRKFYTSCDAMLSCSESFSNIFRENYNDIFAFLNTGSPRIDKLFKAELIKDNLKKKLGLPANKKLILFVPTFRNSFEDSGINQLNSFDFDKLFSTLNSKFGGNWVMIFRGHNLVFERIKKSGLDWSNYLLNGNLFDEMNDYLICADAVITDYSGCIYDLLFTKIPVFLYCLDKETYIKERGLETNIESLPFSCSCSFNELLSNIKEYSSVSSNNERAKVLINMGSFDDGNASKRVIKFMESIHEK